MSVNKDFRNFTPQEKQETLKRLAGETKIEGYTSIPNMVIALELDAECLRLLLVCRILAFCNDRGVDNKKFIGCLKYNGGGAVLPEDIADLIGSDEESVLANLETLQELGFLDRYEEYRKERIYYPEKREYKYETFSDKYWRLTNYDVWFVKKDTETKQPFIQKAILTKSTEKQAINEDVFDNVFHRMRDIANTYAFYFQRLHAGISDNSSKAKIQKLAEIYFNEVIYDDYRKFLKEFVGEHNIETEMEATPLYKHNSDAQDIVNIITSGRTLPVTDDVICPNSMKFVEMAKANCDFGDKIEQAVMKIKENAKSYLKGKK